VDLGHRTLEHAECPEQGRDDQALSRPAAPTGRSWLVPVATNLVSQGREQTQPPIDLVQSKGHARPPGQHGRALVGEIGRATDPRNGSGA